MVAIKIKRCPYLLGNLPSESSQYSCRSLYSKIMHLYAPSSLESNAFGGSGRFSGDCLSNYGVQYSFRVTLITLESETISIGLHPDLLGERDFRFFERSYRPQSPHNHILGLTQPPCQDRSPWLRGSHLTSCIFPRQSSFDRHNSRKGQAPDFFSSSTRLPPFKGTAMRSDRSTGGTRSVGVTGTPRDPLPSTSVLTTRLTARME